MKLGFKQANKSISGIQKCHTMRYKVVITRNKVAIYNLKNKGMHLWFHKKPLTSMKPFQCSKCSLYWKKHGSLGYKMFFTLRKTFMSV